MMIRILLQWGLEERKDIFWVLLTKKICQLIGVKIHQKKRKEKKRKKKKKGCGMKVMCV